MTTKPVCVVLFKKRLLKKTVYTLSLEPGIWVYFRHYLTSRLRARAVWVAFLLCTTVQSTSTTHNLLVILLPQPPSKKLGVAAPGSHVGFCAGSVPLPATVNRSTELLHHGHTITIYHTNAHLFSTQRCWNRRRPLQIRS